MSGDSRKRGERCCDRQLDLRLDADRAEQLSADLGILAHPLRLQILEILSRQDGWVCVCDLEAALPIKQPTISHHLKLLRDAGLVDSERRSIWAYYFVKKPALEALRRRVADGLETLG